MRLRLPAFLRRRPQLPDIAVLDDFFPQQLSAFRFEEFRSYLDALPSLRVYSTGSSFGTGDEHRSIEQVICEHIGNYPSHRGRVSPL
jgi:hypothetical protein